MERTEAIAYLTADNLAVPCSRYGRDAADCAPVAWRVAEIIADATGEPITADSLDHVMGLVVNDHDDPESLIRSHGTRDDYLSLLDYLDPADAPHAGHFSRLGGTYWCDTCNSPYCELA